MPSDEEYAWFAGFFEGEGTVRKGRNFGMSLCTTDGDIAERVHALFGGSLWSGPPRGNLGKKLRYDWQLTSQSEVNRLMFRIYPHLGERRRKAWADALELRLQWTERAPGNKFKSECKRGHSLANSYVAKNGSRHCRTCNAAAQRRYMAKVRS